MAHRRAAAATAAAAAEQVVLLLHALRWHADMVAWLLLLHRALRSSILFTLWLLFPTLGENSSETTVLLLYLENGTLLPL